MPLSRFLKIFIHPDREHLLLFSTKRRSKVIVPASVLAAAEAGTLSPTQAKILTELGFLVPDHEQEKEEIRAYLGAFASLRKGFSVQLIINLDCNLACTYCYEGTAKGKKYLNAPTADRLVSFIKENGTTLGKDISVTFHGGEPLLSFDLIKEISAKLLDLATEASVKYGFRIISNGTLLGAERVKELLPLGLQDVKLTLDGPREIHDRFRPYVSGKESFDRIVTNLQEICGLIPVSLGGNYTRETYKEFPRLLDFLIGNGLGPDKIESIQFVAIMKTVADVALPDFRDGCDCESEPWAVEAALYLRAEVLRRGYATAKVNLAACMAHLDSDVVVNYDGKIFKCPAFISIPELSIGDIFTGIGNYRDSHDLDAWKNPECLDCAYLPLCFGGCKLMQYVRTGSIKGLDCRKSYLDATLEEFIKQEVRYRSQK